MAVEFTVAVPTHDRRETVVMAVRSVLAQTRPPAAVLVLCDGCTDGTAEAVRALGDPRVEALELAKGPGYAYDHRNRALGRARTEAIAWLADDDLLLPDHFERIGELWDGGRCDLVQSGAVRVDPDDSLTWMGADWSVPELRAGFERENTTPMSSICVRTELVRVAGGWDGGVPRAGDWDLWRRLLAAGARTAMSPEPTHLHFRATGREQAWPLRVLQNAEWLARMDDPAQLLAMRVALRRARELRDAERLAAAAALERRAVEAERYGAGVAADREAIRAQLTAVDADRHAIAERLASAEAAREAAETRAHAAEAESIVVATKLAQIENGGWWRLRERLLPLLRAFGRSS